MSGGDADYVKQQYRSLCTLDFKSMSAAAMSLVKQVNDGKAKSTGHKEHILYRGLRVFDINQKDFSESAVRQESIEAARKMVIDVIGNKIAGVETNPIPLETKASKNETQTAGRQSKSSIDDELKELLSMAPPNEKGYIHKSGDRRKFAKA